MKQQSRATPLMEQYLSIKAQHQDKVLLFRMGDFYETFFEDAKLVSKVLGLVLTARDKHNESMVPLAGFPYHQIDAYLPKLIKAGYRVAVCEQVEDPKKAKGIVKRKVIEVVTPGTTLVPATLEAKENNYLAACYPGKKRFGWAILDNSTGEFKAAELPPEKVYDEIKRLHVREILLPEPQAALLNNVNHALVTPRGEYKFSYNESFRLLTQHFGVSTLVGFGLPNDSVMINAAGAILDYAKETQGDNTAHITTISSYSPEGYLILDETTRRNLELFDPLTPDTRARTLISILDKTNTAMGARLLRQWISLPLQDPVQIGERLDVVQEFIASYSFTEDIKAVLKKMNDLERLAAKIGAEKANPRDLLGLKASLELCAELKTLLGKSKTTLTNRLAKQLDKVIEAVQLIDTAIEPEAPAYFGQGRVIKTGYSEQLDEIYHGIKDGKEWIASLQKVERERTGIASLKVAYNKVFGYYIEVTNTNIAKVPDNYIRKQTITNAERYITSELKKWEDTILGAEERILNMEKELFSFIIAACKNHIVPIQSNAKIIAQLDVLLSFADVAILNNYTRPELIADNLVEIIQGRHPVIETLLEDEPFVPNDCYLDTEKQIIILTGPNMAGKSTFIRQVGLIALLAHIGCFVPAQKARIGILDRIFTRVGASDNLAAGMSTFLMEMTEAANILRHATPRSLVLLDEIGRGTSTFDGLSLAWAIAEYLHENQERAAKTIFATHYHELTELEILYPRIHNFNVAVTEHGDKVIFLRSIREGGADKSYGIQVAKLAGIPQQVIDRAKQVLSNLEANELTPDLKPKLAKSVDSKSAMQLTIFQDNFQPLAADLLEIDINSLTPIQALNLIVELREKAKKLSE